MAQCTVSVHRHLSMKTIPWNAKYWKQKAQNILLYCVVVCVFLLWSPKLQSRFTCCENLSYKSYLIGSDKSPLWSFNESILWLIILVGKGRKKQFHLIFTFPWIINFHIIYLVNFDFYDVRYHTRCYNSVLLSFFLIPQGI